MCHPSIVPSFLVLSWHDLSSFVLLIQQFLFWEECHVHDSPIEPSSEEGNFRTLCLFCSREKGKYLGEARHVERISEKSRSRHLDTYALTVAHHLILHIELKLFVVDSLLDFVQIDHILQAEALRWLVFDKGLEDFACAVLRRCTDRCDLLDEQDLIVDFQPHHL